MTPLLADECVGARLVAALRDADYDVRVVAEDAPGEPDTAVLARAETAGRVLLTEDTDFGELVVRLGLAARGVVLLRLHGLGPDARVARVLDALAAYGDRLAGSLCVIEPGRVRLRPLAL